MSEKILRDLYDKNASNGGLWVALSQALGHEYPLSTDDFKRYWQMRSAEEVLVKVNEIVIWFNEEMGKVKLGMHLVAEIIINCLDKTTLLRVIHSGDTTVDKALADYFKTLGVQTNYLDLISVLVEGKWDMVPEVEA